MIDNEEIELIMLRTHHFQKNLNYVYKSDQLNKELWFCESNIYLGVTIYED